MWISRDLRAAVSPLTRARNFLWFRKRGGILCFHMAAPLAPPWAAKTGTAAGGGIASF
jgi:hypothetical protein